jgi:hypothetical protein
MHFERLVLKRITVIKNSYLLVGSWLPLVENNKRKLPDDGQTLMLSTQAAVNMHSFILNTENLSYSALELPEMYFASLF